MKEFRDFQAMAVNARAKQANARYVARMACVFADPTYGPVAREHQAAYGNKFISAYGLKLWLVARMLAPIAEWKAAGVRSGGIGAIDWIAQGLRPSTPLTRSRTESEFHNFESTILACPDTPAGYS